MARNAIGYGAADCVLVVVFEKMSPGSLGRTWTDRADPIGRSVAMSAQIRQQPDASTAIQFFANAGQEYIEKYMSSKYNEVRAILTFLQIWG